MKPDLFVKACLALAVLLLAIIALRPVPKSVEAATQRMYLVVQSQGAMGGNADAFTIELNKLASEGWHLHTVTRDNLILEK